jgi:dCMP deaminase
MESTNLLRLNVKRRKFLAIADAVANLSKDDSTQVGALILGPDGEGGPWGYNGAPRGCSADEDDRRHRPEKYYWFEHAERNAIYSAARTGFSTVGCTMYVTHFPCMDCARAIVQAGIKRVITYMPADEFVERWGEHMIRTKQLFEECGVEVQIDS